MPKTLQFHDHKGDLVPAPKDLKTVLATHDGNTIVWSQNEKGTLRVRYCLEANTFYNDVRAAENFGLAVRHHLECQGKI